MLLVRVNTLRGKRIALLQMVNITDMNVKSFQRMTEKELFPREKNLPKMDMNLVMNADHKNRRGNTTVQFGWDAKKYQSVRK